MSTTSDPIEFIDRDRLVDAENGSWFTILGAGGDLSEWVTGITDAMAERDLGRPVRWYQTNGAVVNEYATQKKGPIVDDDRLPGGTVVLMFPLEGLPISRMAIFRIQYDARWFDDVISNMETR